MTTQCSVCDRRELPEVLVKCPDCNAKVCQVCYSKTLVSEFGIKCLSCNVQFPDSQWPTIFPTSLIAQVRKRAGEDLFVEADARRGILQQKAVQEQQIRVLLAPLAAIQTARKQEERIMAKAKKAREHLVKEEQDLRGVASIQRQENRRTGVTNTAASIAASIVAGTVSTRACLTDGCRGRLNTEYFCTICTLQYCQKCDELGHAGDCVAANVATAELIRATTKPCPRCGGPISKASGCDQMFCNRPGCHCFFNWETGLELAATAPRHNPHYYDLMRTGVVVAPRAQTRLEGWGKHEAYVLNKLRKYRCISGLRRVIEQNIDRIFSLIRVINHFSDAYPTSLVRDLRLCQTREEQIMIDHTLGAEFDANTGATTPATQATTTKALVSLQATRVYWDQHSRLTTAFITDVQALFASVEAYRSMDSESQLLERLYEPARALITAYNERTAAIAVRGMFIKQAPEILLPSWTLGAHRRQDYGY